MIEFPHIKCENCQFGSLWSFGKSAEPLPRIGEAVRRRDIPEGRLTPFPLPVAPFFACGGLRISAAENAPTGFLWAFWRYALIHGIPRRGFMDLEPPSPKGVTESDTP